MRVGVFASSSNDEFPFEEASLPWLRKGLERLRAKQPECDVLYASDKGRVSCGVALTAWLEGRTRGGAWLIDWDAEGDWLTVAALDEFDALIVINGAHDFTHCGGGVACDGRRRKFERLLRQTSARVYAPADVQRYILYKHRYYADLERGGVPVAPFFAVRHETIRTLADAAAFRDEVGARGWNGVIIKPAYGAYSAGIRTFDHFSRVKDKTVLRHMRLLTEGHYPSPSTAQQFVRSFGDHYEVRTYWLRERYQYSVATLTRSVKSKGDAIRGGALSIHDMTTFRSEGGRLDDALLVDLKRTARCVFRSLDASMRDGASKHVFVRIDFGCCLPTPEGASCATSKETTFFVNEVETIWCNLLLHDHPQKGANDFLPRLGAALLSHLGRKETRRTKTKSKKAKTRANKER